jgi:hypothetical protein
LAFTTLVRPFGQVEPLLPVQGQQHVEVPVRFAWAPVDEADSYTFELYTDLLRTLVQQTSLSDTTVVVESLSYGQDYQWRVRAARGQQRSSWSTFMEMRTLAADKVLEDSVRLEGPDDGGEVAQRRVTLQWATMANATFYEVELRDQDSVVVYADTVRSSEAMSGAGMAASGSSTMRVEVAGLSHGQRYQWRVKAANEVTQTPWSGYKEFVVVLPPTRWDGPVVVVSRQAGQQVRDSLTVDVVLTRGANGLLYNAVREDGASQQSPLGTRWVEATLSGVG